jgi:hypothetical protein
MNRKIAAHVTLMGFAIPLILLVTLLALAACTQPSDSQTDLPIPATKAEVPRVIAQRLWQEIQDGGDILIVDTRNEDAYAEEHIEGAISVPSERIEAGDWQPPEGKQLVLY